MSALDTLFGIRPPLLETLLGKQAYSQFADFHGGMGTQQQNADLQASAMQNQEWLSKAPGQTAAPAPASVAPAPVSAPPEPSTAYANTAALPAWSKGPQSPAMSPPSAGNRPDWSYNASNPAGSYQGYPTAATTAPLPARGYDQQHQAQQPPAYHPYQPEDAVGSFQASAAPVANTPSWFQSPAASTPPMPPVGAPPSRPPASAGYPMGSNTQGQPTPQEIAQGTPRRIVPGSSGLGMDYATQQAQRQSAYDRSHPSRQPAPPPPPGPANYRDSVTGDPYGNRPSAGDPWAPGRFGSINDGSNRMKAQWAYNDQQAAHAVDPNRMPSNQDLQEYASATGTPVSNQMRMGVGADGRPLTYRSLWNGARGHNPLSPTAQVNRMNTQRSGYSNPHRM